MAGLVGEYGALTACRAALAEGLPAVLAALNAELAGAGLDLALADPAEVSLRAQLAQYPSHLAALPALHLVPVVTLSGRSGASADRAAQPGALEVDAGVYLAGAEGADGLDLEGALIAQVCAWRVALRRCLRRPQAQGGLLGRAGVERVAVIAGRQELWQVNVNNGVIVGVLGVTRLRLEYEER